LCRTLRTAGESKDYLRDIRHSSQVQPESSLSTTKQQCELRSRPDSCSEGAQQPSSKSTKSSTNSTLPLRESGRLEAMYLPMSKLP